MRRCRFLSLFLLAAFASLSIGNTALPAAEQTAADVLPKSTVAYAEITQPAKLLDLLLEHPLRDKLAQLDEYQDLTEENPDFLKFRAIVGVVEFKLGRKWPEALAALAGDGLYFAVDAETQGAVLLARAPDADALDDVLDKLREMAREDAKKKGKPAPFEERTYRDQTIYKLEKAVLATFGRWLIVTNKPDLGRVVADNILDGGTDTLAEQEQFIAARRTVSGKPVGWAYANIEMLRGAGAAKKLFQEKSDNPGAELLLGGVIGALQNTPLLTAAVYLDDDQLRLAVQMPHDPTAVPEKRQYFFGEHGKGTAPAPLAPKNRLAAVTSYRDVGQMWQRRSDVFNENANARLTQADSNLSTVFGGLDFGREVLGALQPQVQIVAAEQNFAERKSRVPKIKLPAAAFVFQLKDPEKMQRQLKISFQSLIGLTNLGAGQNELPQLEMKTEDRDGGHIVSTAYPGGEEEPDVSNDIIYNFSPSIAFVDDYFIFSSTRELAAELFDLAKGTTQPPARIDGDEADDESVVNTLVKIDAGVLRRVLRQNREPLIAQNMLENGHTRDEAKKEVGVLFALLSVLKESSLALATEEDMLRGELSVRFAGQE